MNPGSRWLRLWALLNGALVLALVGSALFSRDGLTERERRRQELGQVRELNDTLAQENAVLRREIQALQTDAPHLESVIREETGWVRDDEVVYVIPR